MGQLRVEGREGFKIDSYSSEGPEDARLNMVGSRWGKFFSCTIRTVAFSNRSCRKNCARNQSDRLTIEAANISAIVQGLFKGMGGFDESRRKSAVGGVFSSSR
jgi:hypothetical protein